MNAPLTRVVVAEDSPTVREFLVHAFNAAPGMQVVATANSGLQALQAVRDTHPDVVTMDVNMPTMDGLEATRRIMSECPVPIVIVSGIFSDKVLASIRALEAGALSYVRTPLGPDDPSHDEAVADLVTIVKLMSEVRVVKRKKRVKERPHHEHAELMPSQAVRMVAIGASTGGPGAILELLNSIPKDFGVPILIVQHIAVGFTEGLVEWLATMTGHAVSVARNEEVPLAGHIYVAPEGVQMGLDRIGRIALADAAPENGLRPSVSYLFRSLREQYAGTSAAVLLSGMGKDGAQELLTLKQAGCLTFVQDRASSTIFGMPGEAVRLDAASFVMPPNKIGEALTDVAKGRMAGLDA